MFLMAAGHHNRHIEASAVIAQASVKNHVASCGECAHGLLHGDWLVEGEHCSGSLHVRPALLAAHDYQRYGAGARSFLLQFAKELACAIQVTVNDESVNF